MKRQLVKETVINKQTLLFVYTGGGAFGHELGLVFDVGGGRGVCPAHTHGGKVNDVSRQGGWPPLNG